ncbi:class I SAM-dependent methyltransferase [Rhizobium sp. FY34]|uniref:class I SAM-dependent methyltransferase n=1 Tax=Rhizobium sp. FY34 TaxID=2562309 RepID=UPI0010C023A8|nr:class I SAM-dependent methyltransferase [Rhizobium sp. FY34]
MDEKPDTTRHFYAEKAATYAADTVDQPVSAHLRQFTAALAPQARVLELGCGSGRDSAVMLAKGLTVTPTDGTPEMAAQATASLGRPVAVLAFGDLCDEAAYDAVWANACLLHVPRADLAGILRRIQRALVPGGLFYASYKAGTAEGLDRFGRYYNFPDEIWLRQAYGAGWSSLVLEETRGSGYDGVPTPWLHMLARKAI